MICRRVKTSYWPNLFNTIWWSWISFIWYNLRVIFYNASWTSKTTRSVKHIFKSNNRYASILAVVCKPVTRYTLVSSIGTQTQSIIYFNRDMCFLFGSKPCSIFLILLRVFKHVFLLLNLPAMEVPQFFYSLPHRLHL